MLRSGRGKKYATTDNADPKSTSLCPNETGHIWNYNDFRTKYPLLNAGSDLEVQCSGIDR